ncbi:CAP domain-containing protein [Anaerotignum sp.]|uniref:CAP domain-containing protein n=1 Tax=Anaerotignum sp. TaxID=2039241 RepID=UPI00331934E2
MKKFRLISAVSVAVLSMSVQAMAMPLSGNTASLQCKNVTAVKNCITANCSSNGSTSKSCVNSLDINSILKGLNGSSVKPSITIPNFNCNLNGGSCDNGSCDNGSCDNGSCDNGSGNAGSGNTGSGNAGSGNAGSGNNGNTSEDTSASISAYAQKVVDLVNEERAKQGISPLAVDADVMKAAQIRAKEIQTSFSHTRPDGRSCFTALDEAGASYRGAGENIALGQKTPEQVVNAWMNSEGHRKNILNSNFKSIGVGVDGTAWTQLFTY